MFNFSIFEISAGSFCQKDQVSALSLDKRNICLNKYAITSEGKVSLQIMDSGVTKFKSGPESEFELTFVPSDNSEFLNN